jgi:hypothetical protein
MEQEKAHHQKVGYKHSRARPSRALCLADGIWGANRNPLFTEVYL